MSYREYACFKWNDCVYIVPENPGLPRPKRIIGTRRRYHNSTTPPLDFR